tara:strand:+ start:1790 stop:1987 length:198 start_codon:yes stop_codon:yes gene_type:complete
LKTAKQGSRLTLGKKVTAQCFERPRKFERVEGVRRFEEVSISEVRHKIGDETLADRLCALPREGQ